MQTSTKLAGILWCFVFVTLEAVQAVYFGSVFQDVSPFLVGGTIFTVTTLGCLCWVQLRAPAEAVAAWRSRSSVVGMNVAAAVAWLAYLPSIALIEPAIAFTIFSGMVPLAAVGAYFLGVPEGEKPRSVVELSGLSLISLSLAFLSLITLLSVSGFVARSLLTAALGTCLAAASGIGIAVMLFYCRRLAKAGVGSVAQFGLRFLLYVPLAAAGNVLFARQYAIPTLLDAIFIFVVGLLVIAFPIYAVQKSIIMVDALTVGVLTSLGPLFVFLFQMIEGRFDQSSLTLCGLAIYFAGAVSAAFGATRYDESKSNAIRLM